MSPESAPEPKSRLARAKDSAEFLSKLIPLLAGIIYVAGYVVTAQRLAEYNVSITQLVNAQYFTAGMAPGLITCLTFAAIYDAYCYDRSNPNKLTIAGILTSALFFLTLLLTGINYFLGRFGRAQFLGEDHWFDFYVMTLLRLVLGIAAVWYLVAGLKTGMLLRSAKQLRSVGSSFAEAIQANVYILVIGVASLVICYQRSTAAYARIPQAYGGGRPLVVRLYVERDKTPSELIDGRSIVTTGAAEKNPVNPSPGSAPATINSADPGPADKGLVYSVPLKLIFQTSDSLIVDSAAAGNPARVWTLDAHAVHAVLSNP